MNLYGYEFQRESDLMHYGVLGMKWGVRRYQNKDGSLTKAGKKHYNSEKTNKDFSKNESKKVVKRIENSEVYKNYGFEGDYSNPFFEKYRQQLYDANEKMANDPRYYSEDADEFLKAVNEHMKPMVDKYVSAYQHLLLKDLGYSTSKQSIEYFNEFLKKHKRDFLALPLYGDISQWFG